MKYIMAALLMLLAGSALASDTFYNKSVGFWEITGIPGDENLDPACVVSTQFKDGSAILIAQNMKNREAHIEFQNMQWDIEGPYNTVHKMRMNFYSKNFSETLFAEVVLENKNTIRIPNLTVSSFFPLFVNSEKMVIIPEGDTSNANFSLDDSKEAFYNLVDCMKEFLGENK